MPISTFSPSFTPISKVSAQPPRVAIETNSINPTSISPFVMSSGGQGSGALGGLAARLGIIQRAQGLGGPVRKRRVGVGSAMGDQANDPNAANGPTDLAQDPTMADPSNLLARFQAIGGGLGSTRPAGW